MRRFQPPHAPSVSKPSRRPVSTAGIIVDVLTAAVSLFGLALLAAAAAQAFTFDGDTRAAENLVPIPIAMMLFPAISLLARRYWVTAALLGLPAIVVGGLIITEPDSGAGSLLYLPLGPVAFGAVVLWIARR